ncbi:hypothetical protein MBM_04875 [Drepanopeziza brunnea f. sp. 'multigermtubi' MB_m1]|uniref:BTB domain-containing protein n=1 Tax=Marssonina brunnea f. sp. multigermtubi (strain MB_m1) TaxID=1072389 RepID=K1X985_MARBU|nr:uncharacterized protein MBM_04875 [Drepanopeziza brunnea f. sp. 'multigermtubi' MB_m1]EKD17298.1 hypothetical protein MBM_04875 [Drepanopeziza brunnea f. sp. 'multigermtubi' MB_m1]
MTSKVFQLSAEAMGTEIVTIYVGPKRKPFVLHKKLLCDRSEFFSKALNGGFKESAEGIMYLPEDDADVFEVTNMFIYQDALPAFPSDKYPATAAGTRTFINVVLFQQFAFASKICFDYLANRVMDMIQDVQREQTRFPVLPMIAFAYQNTSEKSKLRIYCVLMCLLMVNWRAKGVSINVTHQDQGKALGEVVQRHPDFGSDYLEYEWKYVQMFREGKLRVLNILKRTDEGGLGRCFFHSHLKNSTCHLDLEKV